QHLQFEEVHTAILGGRSGADERSPRISCAAAPPAPWPATNRHSARATSVHGSHPSATEAAVATIVHAWAQGVSTFDTKKYSSIVRAPALAPRSDDSVR